MNRNLESRADFDAAVAGGSLVDAFLESLDLRDRGGALRSVPVRGAVFLGCLLTEADAAFLTEAGALIFPTLPNLPFNPYRPDLYRPEELYEGLAGGYRATTDARIYRWFVSHARPGDLAAELACTLHDHAIAESLEEELAERDPRLTVGIMGGHALRRDSADYAEAATLAHALAAAGRLVVTGGGPGAMEAGNLGAAFSGDVASLREALTELAAVAGWRHVDEWAQAAFAVRARWELTRPSLGIPTWFYGHEPPNAFANRIAKFFSNAVREDTLLRLCRGGLVFLPGAAGTVQELFQSVTPNYYAPDETAVAPLVLLGRDFWTRTVPAWDLIATLARDRPMASHVHLVDTAEEAVGLLTAGPTT